MTQLYSVKPSSLYGAVIIYTQFGLMGKLLNSTRLVQHGMKFHDVYTFINYINFCIAVYI